MNTLCESEVLPHKILDTPDNAHAEEIEPVEFQPYKSKGLDGLDRLATMFAGGWHFPLLLERSLRGDGPVTR